MLHRKRRRRRVDGSYIPCIQPDTELEDRRQRQMEKRRQLMLDTELESRKREQKRLMEERSNNQMIAMPQLTATVRPPSQVQEANPPSALMLPQGHREGLPVSPFSLKLDESRMDTDAQERENESSTASVAHRYDYAVSTMRSSLLSEQIPSNQCGPLAARLRRMAVQDMHYPAVGGASSIFGSIGQSSQVPSFVGASEPHGTGSSVGSNSSRSSRSRSHNSEQPMMTDGDSPKHTAMGLLHLH
ncbi:MAG: hypothetical protein MHM6MM_004547 [Cercozoa sp. M6MM]